MQETVTNKKWRTERRLRPGTGKIGKTNMKKEQEIVMESDKSMKLFESL